jgi:uncharacterized SAM-binding protein YcdF (DUF218 family)/Na+-transporting methylmalonyl-CoA/oxaloacetate decarboxylase gamma subunit
MLKRAPSKLSRSVSLSSQRGSLLHGFGKMILGFTFVITILVLLASTSFLSDFILKKMMQIPIVVNPIAAATHQSLNSDSIAKAQLNSQTKLEKSKKASLMPVSQDIDNKKDSTLETNTDQALSIPVDDTLIAHVLDSTPDKALSLVASSPLHVLDGSNDAQAQAIVVLGGGLTLDQNGVIIPNSYTQLRLMQAVSQHRATGLPIFLTGVEAPYMQKFLQAHGESAQWLESRSMNTCENARFSALLLQSLGGAPRVELVTDEWHIPRARWLFAMNGIETVAVPAALPGDPSPWWPDARNLTHTRRAVHELIAYTRDRVFGVIGCREVP